MGSKRTHGAAKPHCDPQTHDYRRMVNTRGFTLLGLVGMCLTLAWVGGQLNDREKRSAEPLPPAPLANKLPVLPAAITPYSTGSLPILDAPASDLRDFARRVAGARFAGLWLDPSPHPTYRVGIVSPTGSDVDRIERAFRSIGVTGTVRPAKFSEQKLVQIGSYLAERLTRVNQGSEIGVSIGRQENLNAIEIRMPSLGRPTKAQRAFATAAARQFRAAVRIAPSTAGGPQQDRVMPCRDVFCDPPLRSGISVFTDVTGCTGSFLARARSDGRLYQVTAGHCNLVWDATWLTDLTSGLPHEIGPLHKSVFALGGDAGIYHVRAPSYWKSRAWVSVRAGSGATTDQDYPIWTDASPIVGIRVCVSGAGTRAASCGVVTTVGVAVTYPWRGKLITVSGLARANFCASAGDSGSPVFAGHVAFGILSGGSRSGVNQCSSLFEPIQTAEKLLNVNVAHDVR